MRAAARNQPGNPDRVRMREISLDRTFVSDETGVKIQYPSSWQRLDLMQETPPLTLVTMFLSNEEHPTGVRQNINLVVEDLPSALSLPEYTDLGIAMEKEFFDHYAVLKSEDVLLAGAYHAHRVFFTASLNGGDMTFEQIWLLKDKKALVWTFADSADVFGQHVTTFERMMDTMTVR